LLHPTLGLFDLPTLLTQTLCKQCRFGGLPAGAGHRSRAATISFLNFVTSLVRDGLFVSRHAASFHSCVSDRPTLSRREKTLWRWEIYRAGGMSPIDYSEVFFDSVTEANRAGKAALRLLLGEYAD
jgi:hypothetical protein